MKNNKLLSFVFALAIPLLAGFIGSLFTTPSINTWYLNINKPSFNPPNWIFAPVWTILFILMGISLYLIWQSTIKDKTKSLILFYTQLILNILWSYLFFSLHNPLLAFIDIILLAIFIILLIISTYKISKTASLILLPYIFWVSFASILNYSIFILN